MNNVAQLLLMYIPVDDCVIIFAPDLEAIVMAGWNVTQYVDLKHKNSVNSY